METNFDDILKQSATNFAAEAPTESWGFIADALHKKKKRRYFWFFFLGLFTSVIIGSGIYFSKNIFNSKNTSNSFKKNIDTTLLSQKGEIIISNINNQFPEDIIKKQESILPISINSNHQNIAKLIPKIKDEKIFLQEKIKISTNKKQNISTIKGEVETDDFTFIKEKVNDNISSNEKVEANEIENIINKKNITEILTDSFELKKVIKEKINELLTLDTSKNLAKRNYTKKRESSINYIVQFNLERLYVNRNNLITNLSVAKSAANRLDNIYSSPIPLYAGSAVRPSSTNPSIYLNGKTFAVSFLANKQIKKRLAINLGINLKYNEYSSKAFRAFPLAVTNSNNYLVSDSNAVNPNSFYSLNRTLLPFSDKIILKNKFYDVGIICGVNYIFLKMKRNNTLQIQTQIATDFSFNNSINLLNKNNSRFFKDKNLTKNLNLYQSFSLQYFNKSNNYSLGPVYSFMYNKINKDIINLGFIKTSSFGLQFQYFLKPYKKK